MEGGSSSKTQWTDMLDPLDVAGVELEPLLHLAVGTKDFDRWTNRCQIALANKNGMDTSLPFGDAS